MKKGMILTGVYAAFSGAVDTFLNANKGGGGYRNWPSFAAHFRGFGRALFVVLAVAGLSAAANAHSGADAVHEYAVKCLENSQHVDAHADEIGAPLFAACETRVIEPAVSGDDKPGVIIYGWLDAEGSATNSGNHYVIINRSDDPVVYEGGAGSRLYLQPRTANSPTLFLSVLVGGTATVPANRQLLISFDGIDVDIESLYWSEPQMLPCPEFENADGMCEAFRTCDADQTLNRETNMCEGGGDDGGGGGNNNTPPVGDNPRTSTPPQRGDHDYVPAIAGGVGILLLAGWHILTDGGDIDDFSFSPDFGYAITESGYSYKYGGRLDFRKDAWSLYWTAGQRNANGEFGDFRYESGGEYDGGFWRAAFSESVVGETTDYDFSLSADYAGGIWKISPEFFADARYKNGEFAMTNSFRISGELRFDDWRFAASGSAERVRLSAVRRF